MAAGNSTVGRTLASLLRWSFIDLDYEVLGQNNGMLMVSKLLFVDWSANACTRCFPA